MEQIKIFFVRTKTQKTKHILHFIAKGSVKCTFLCTTAFATSNVVKPCVYLN